MVEEFIKLSQNRTDKRMKILRTDNGREYLNATLKETLDKNEIKHETSIAYYPQSNGRAEHTNRVLLEKAKCMLLDANLPNKFWAEAIATAAYLFNRSPKKCLGERTPEELWTNKKPDLSNLQVFYCRAAVYTPEHKRKKMDPAGKPH